MGVNYDFSDVDGFFSDVKKSVRQCFEIVGANAVEYARENGNYKDRTGNLRASNTFHADENILTLENTADYASHVESRGYDVISGALLEMERELGL